MRPTEGHVHQFATDFSTILVPMANWPAATVPIARLGRVTVETTTTTTTTVGLKG